MFCASVVVAALLSASGDVPKAAEAPEHVRGVANPAFVTPAHELQYLKKNRPSLDGAGAALSVGGVVCAIGAAFVVLSLVHVDPRGGIRNEGQVFGLMIGGAVFGLGALVGIGGGIAMGAIGGELTRVDARIRVLEAQLAAPPPASLRIPILPPLVLAW